MKKVMGEFKFLVPAMLTISIMLVGCKGATDMDQLARGINICIEVRNCEDYGSNQGNLQLVLSASGDLYNYFDYDDSSDLSYKNVQKTYSFSSNQNIISGRTACATYNLQHSQGQKKVVDKRPSTHTDLNTYADGVNFFRWEAFKLQSVNYTPKDTQGKGIYVDNNNKQVTNLDPISFEIFKKDNPLIAPFQGQRGTKSYAHLLDLQPIISKIDFDKGLGEVIFDCQNPKGEGDVNSQLSKFLLKETIKNKFKSLTNSAMASKEVSETKSAKEQEIKDNKKEQKESSIAL